MPDRVAPAGLALDALQSCAPRHLTEIGPIRCLLAAPARVDLAPLTYSGGLAPGLRTVVSDSIASRDHAASVKGEVAGCSNPRAVAIVHLVAGQRSAHRSSREAMPKHFVHSVVMASAGSGV